jgi:N-methylhydantoinase A
VGLVLADVIRDYSRSVLQPGDTPASELDRLFAPLRKQAAAEMGAEGISGDALRLEPALDMRYRGQSFEITVPLAGDFCATFHERYQDLYGYRDEQRPLEIVTLRLRAVGRGAQPEFHQNLQRVGELRPLAVESLVLAGEPQPCPIYERSALPCGVTLAGPALIVEETATHLLNPGWRLRVDELANLLLEREGV